MLKAMFKALGDVVSPELRSILFKAIAMTAALFVAILIVVEVAINYLVRFSWTWADWVLSIGTGLILVVAFFFLIAPVTVAFAGLFLDRVAERVEKKHYPADRPGTALVGFSALLVTLRFGGLVLLVNLALLPAIFLGIGAILLLIINAYLLSREYFEMAAMRHMTVDDALRLRRENGPFVFVSGLIPALLALVPIVNLALPLFATAYFVHIFKWVRASSA